ncbi:MAG: hypothetical protein K2O63_05825 [Alistipes sp.]|nr:hypothetical protein [Alistipes sp.]
MKKILSHLWCAALLALACTACDSSSAEEPQPQIEPTGVSFVRNYVTINKLVLHTIFPFGHLAVYTDRFNEEFDSSEESHRTYAEQHDDRYYDGPETERVSDVLGKTVCKVSAVTEDDYNPHYPAGSSLDEIIRINVQTYAPFVRSKCRDQALRDNQYVYKRLYDLTPEEGALWRPQSIAFFLDEFPQVSAEPRTIELTFLFDDGTELKSKIHLYGNDEIL